MLNVLYNWYQGLKKSILVLYSTLFELSCEFGGTCDVHLTPQSPCLPNLDCTRRTYNSSSSSSSPSSPARSSPPSSNSHLRDANTSTEPSVRKILHMRSISTICERRETGYALVEQGNRVHIVAQGATVPIQHQRAHDPLPIINIGPRQLAYLSRRQRKVCGAWRVWRWAVKQDVSFDACGDQVREMWMPQC